MRKIKAIRPADIIIISGAVANLAVISVIILYYFLGS